MRIREFLRGVWSIKWFRLAMGLAIILGLVGLWLNTIAGGSVNRKDPVKLALTFIQDIRSANPNNAYALTTEQYHKNVKFSDFSTDLVPALIKQLPQSTPVLLKQQTKPNDKNSMQVIFDVPADGNVDDTIVLITMTRTKDDWSIQGVTVALKKVPTASQNTPPMPSPPVPVP